MNNTLWIALAVAVVGFLGFMLLPKSGNNASDGNLIKANEYFRQGQFDQAKERYESVLLSDSANTLALFRLALIAQLENKLEDAAKLFRKIVLAPVIKPESLRKDAWANLMVTYQRMDRFAEAAQAARQIDKEAVAAQFSAFAGLMPYEVESASDVTSVKFVVTDPLPLIEVQVNQSEPVYFLIDTGASEIILDPELADRLKIERLGKTTGSFAGGKKSDVEHGKIDSISLGEFVIKNVPVGILNTKRFSPIFGKTVQGILGTSLLSHFLSTLDYPQGSLILRKKTPDSLAGFESHIYNKKIISLPFWMAGDHFMVAWGRLNQSAPMLFFVDTGLAGGGFTASAETLTQTGVSVDLTKAGEGVGGGGKVQIIPVMIPELSLGDAHEKNITGFAGGFPSDLESRFGFRIAGIISHQFFRNYALTFDFSGMRLFLERAKI